MHRFFAYLTLVCCLALGACSGKISADDYNPAECSALLGKAASTKQLSDLGADDWHAIYTQYIASTMRINAECETLINTPWTAQKEADCRAFFDSELLDRHTRLAVYTQSLTIPGFAPASYFSDKEIARMTELNTECENRLAVLRAQADM